VRSLTDAAKPDISPGDVDEAARGRRIVELGEEKRGERITWEIA
jgi:hypothetical protein